MNDEARVNGDAQSLGTTATRGFLWANVGLLSRFGAALVLASLLVRQLSDGDYAAMVALTVVMLYADTALDLGMGAALVYEQEEGQTRRVDVAFSANVAFSLVLAALAVLAAPLIAVLFNLEEYVSAFRMLGPLIMISGLNTVPWALFMRGMAYRPRAYTEIARDGSRLVVTLVLVYGGMGIWGVVWGFIASKVIWTVGTWALTRFRARFAWDGDIVRDLFSYAWKMAGNRFLGLLALNGDYFVVGNRTSTMELSLYYQAFRLPEVVMGGQLNAMSAVLFPMYSRIRSKGTDALRDAMYKALRIVGLFSIPVGVVMALAARDAITVMFGTQGTDAVTVMQVISITGCITGLGFATGDLLYATNRPGLLMRLNAVMVPLMLAAMWIVAGSHGIVGVALVHLGTQAVFVTIRQLIVNRIIGASLLACVAALWPGVAVTAGMLLFGLPVRLLTPGGFVSGLMVVGAAAVGALVALALSPASRAELRDILAKIKGA
ncbi:MAG: oligosaccharide flippase family protein [Actinomycetia bacterium]|nr:oligosaccharide flippase family protein [Actinomycetes bacterium]